jgi:hypothetical protein
VRHCRATAAALLVAFSFWAAACGRSSSQLNHTAGGATSQSNSEYLDSAVGRATEDEVASTLGSPSAKQALGDGGQVWTYRYKYQRTHLIFGHRTLCKQIIVGFDAARILRKWGQGQCSEEAPPPQ